MSHEPLAMDWKTRIRSAFDTRVPDEDVIEELAQHAAATYASARAEGLEPAEADRRVEQQIGAWTANPALLRRRPKREAAVAPPPASGSGITRVAQDARYAWRLLRRQPSYAALVVATMALGIAATTVLGSVAYGVILKPLPWADAPRLVRLYETRQGSTRRFGPMMTNVTYNEWVRDPTTLDAIGAWSVGRLTVFNSGGGERIKVGNVTPGLLSMLRAVPVAGRLFVAGDEEAGRPQIVMLSYGLWQEQFGGRADAIGRTIELDR